MGMDEDGWLVGGGYKSFDYSGKMPWVGLVWWFDWNEKFVLCTGCCTCFVEAEV
jgi:hypothetical protein